MRAGSSECTGVEALAGPRWGRDERGAGAPRIAALAALVVGLAGAPAYADSAGSAHGLHHGGPAAWIGLVLSALIGLGLAARRHRVAGIVSLALLVGCFGLASAVHSVHHFSDPGAAASCVIFCASQNVSGALAETPDVESPTWTFAPVPPGGAERPRPLPPFSSHEGRAPPARFSA